MIKNPTAILYDSSGNPLAQNEGDDTTGASGLISIGVDGDGVARFIATDASGNQVVVDGGGSLTIDQGTASNLNAQVQGTAASGVAPVGNPILTAGFDGTNVRTIKTDTSGNVVSKITDGTNFVGISDVSGAKALKVDVVQTVGGSGGTSSNYAAAFPSAGTASGFSDGTNMQGARVFDADSGAGSQYVLGAILRKSASGGSVEAGTSSDPLRTDPTGTTTQPVSSTQLPSSLVNSRLDCNIGAWLGSTTPSVGQKAMSASIPVAIASDQSYCLISTANSSTSTLGNGGVFNGTSEEVCNYQVVVININSNAASANGGIVCKWSADNSTFFNGETHTYLGGSTQINLSVPVRARYFKITYTNSSTVQSSFNLSVTYKTNHYEIPILTSGYRAATGLITGVASAHNLLSIENPAASTVFVRVQRAKIMSTTIAVVNVKFMFHCGRTTALPSGGSTLTAQKLSTVNAAPTAIVRKAPTATSASGDLWVGTPGSFITAASAYAPHELIVFADPDEECILLPGEAILIKADSNDVDWSHMVSIFWKESVSL